MVASFKGAGHSPGRRGDVRVHYRESGRRCGFSGMWVVTSPRIMEKQTK